MTGTKREIVYWEKPGPGNTARTAALAAARAKALGLTHVVVASNTGETAKALRQALEPIGGVRLVCVTHSVGFQKPNESDMPAQARRELTAAGSRADHDPLLRRRGPRPAVSQGLPPGRIVAMSLRLMGQGLKVAVGSPSWRRTPSWPPRITDHRGGWNGPRREHRSGPPGPRPSFFDTRVVEILCMPRA